MLDNDLGAYDETGVADVELRYRYALPINGSLSISPSREVLSMSTMGMPSVVSVATLLALVEWALLKILAECSALSNELSRSSNDASNENRLDETITVLLNKSKYWSINYVWEYELLGLNTSLIVP